MMMIIQCHYVLVLRSQKSHVPPSVLEAGGLRLWTRHIGSVLECSHPGSLPNRHALYLTDYSTPSWSLRVNQITSANVLLSGHSSSLLIGNSFLTSPSILRGFVQNFAWLELLAIPGSAVRFHTGAVHLALKRKQYLWIIHPFVMLRFRFPASGAEGKSLKVTCARLALKLWSELW